MGFMALSLAVASAEPNQRTPIPEAWDLAQYCSVVGGGGGRRFWPYPRCQRRCRYSSTGRIAMTRISLAFAASAAVLVALLPPTPAQALFRTYVSRGGSDANNCDRPPPCLTMGRAVQQTTSGGIASCLDSNDYTQTVTIDKSMTVDCASVPGTSAAGPFIINTPGVKVTIKNVVIFVNGSPGISFTDGASLVVENCFIRNNPVGISFAPTAVGAKLVVTDTLIKDNT